MASYRSASCLGAVLFGLLLFSGCTNMQSVAVQDGAAPAGIEVGDNVVVQLQNGTTQNMTVTSMNSQGLYDGDRFVAYADMTELQVERVNAGSTALLAIPLVLLLVAAGGGGGGGGVGY